MHQIAPFKKFFPLTKRMASTCACKLLRDMQISKSEKNISCPPPAKSLERP